MSAAKDTRDRGLSIKVQKTSSSLKEMIYASPEESFLNEPSNIQLQQNDGFWSASDLKELIELIDNDRSNLIKHLSDITTILEHACLENQGNCERTWSVLKPLLKSFDHPVIQNSDRPESPTCESRTVSWVNTHGEKWSDDYAWLKNRDSQEVLDYIEAENEYASKIMEPTKPLQKLLYKEFVSRLDQNDESTRVTLQDGWSYYSRNVSGEEYRIHCRTKDDVEHVFLDENELANSEEFKDASYFRLGFIRISPNCKIVAYAIDFNGQERYTTFFRDLDTMEVLKDKIVDVYEDFEFSEDSSCVYYTLLDDCERAYQIKRHILGQDVANDEILLHEEDEMFFLKISKTSDGKYILCKSSAQITSETSYISASNSSCKLHMVIPKQENIHYTCDHHEGYFYILTNENGKNNWIFRIPGPEHRSSNFQDEIHRETVIEHRDFVLIEEFQFRRNHLIVLERSNCLQNLRIIDTTLSNNSDFGQYHYVRFPETVYSIWLGSAEDAVTSLTQRQYDTHIVRFTYTSFTQPKQVIDYDMNLCTMKVIHEEKIPGPVPYDKNQYVSKRLFATSHDGTAIPVSIVYRRALLGMNLNPVQPNPALLHAYGAYGVCLDTAFSTSRLSLLDRGFIFAIAHVRGGADMGNAWYEEGKLSKKPNTFYDFCAVAEFLIKEGYTAPEKLSIYGRSAGGLLIGSVINMRPHLFQAALTEVPFVDVVNTMFDSTIPWTAFEYEEWGNPEDEYIYNVMKSYCPYTNIDGEKLAKNEYPNLLVIGGMNDPRVAFFEPLRLIAKIRKSRKISRKELNGSELAQSDDRMVLLKINDAGHGGNSGQYSYLEDLAFEYAFLISSLQAPMKPILNELVPKYAYIITPQNSLPPLGRKKGWKKNDDDIHQRKSKSRRKASIFKWINQLF